MKSDIEIAVEWSKRLEGLLADKLGAKGKGLHEKVSSVKNRLSQASVKRLRYSLGLLAGGVYRVLRIV